MAITDPNSISTKRTIVYIDGFNLYNRLLRHTNNKWLDLSAFATALLRPDHNIVVVKYFTSRVRPYPNDLLAIARQNIYLQALSQNPLIRIIEGMYDKRKTWLPFADQPCKSCEQVPNHFAHVYKFEEKRTDVNLATNLLLDAVRNAADCFVLISGDSDFVPVIDAVRKELGKTVLVFNPSDVYSVQLATAASYYKSIPRDLPARCQLPDEIPVGKNGRRIHRPPAWTPTPPSL